MNPLEALVQQLTQSAGPRGSTFAGRVIPQGQMPSVESLLAQTPTESPDAEGFGILAGTVVSPKIIRYFSGATGKRTGWHVSPVLLDEAGNEITGKPIDILGTKKAAKAFADKLNKEMFSKE